MATTKPTNKATVYVDVDDEITNIIEKVKSADAKIVALVLPKRAATLQSVVNMKLLKKAAVSSKKNIVLITSEAGLMPLAGAAGLHVAKSLQSKPAIPPPPQHPGEEAEAVEEPEAETRPEADIEKPVPAAEKTEDDTETIEIDNSESEPATSKLATKAKKLKHLKVPNFERFRIGFFLAGLAVLLLIFGWYIAFFVMPRANILIKTDTSTVVSSFDFTASTKQVELDIEDKKIPATSQQVEKTDSETVAATGQRDEGTKASGEVTLSIDCGDVTSFPTTVASGTIVSTSGLNFVTQEEASLSAPGGPGCLFKDTVAVTAAQNGDGYNIGSGKTFTVTGSSTISGMNDSGFGGGTSKIIKVVSQKDIDDAMTKMKSRLDETAKQELQALFETEGLYALTETIRAGKPKITATPARNKEATEVTVKSETKYTMLGITKDHLSQIVKDDVKNEIDSENQAVTDDGIDGSIMRINNQPSDEEAFLSFRTSVIAGPELDENAIKEVVRGKKRGEIQQYISGLPGVTDVEVTYSPFWVYSTPKSASKIIITIEKVSDNQQSTNPDE